MAQVSGILFLSKFQDGKQRVVYFAGIDNAKFRKPVRPGDQLRLELKILRMRQQSYKMHGTAYVDSDIVAEADMLLVAEALEQTA